MNFFIHHLPCLAFDLAFSWLWRRAKSTLVKFAAELNLAFQRALFAQLERIVVRLALCLLPLVAASFHSKRAT